jgi:hypothetical protein
MIGPVDYIVMGFKGNNFDGSILDELTKATDNDTIRVLDLLFIMKDADGNVIEAEFEDQSDEFKEMFGNLDRADDMPLLSDSDVEKIGQQMDKDTSAGVLVIEHTWARDLKKALLDAGGILLADGRVHPEAVETALADLSVANEPLTQGG